MRTRFGRLSIALFAVALAASQVDAQELLYCSPGGPILVRFDVKRDGEPVRQAWQRHLRRLFERLDRDNDGALSPKEMAYLPRAKVLGNFLRQPFIAVNQVKLTPADFRKASGDSVDFDELLAYYRDDDGPIQFFLVNTPATTDSLSTVLWKRLDSDNDDKLSRTEVEKAVDVLQGLDRDDDEVVSIQEVLAASTNPLAAFGGGAMMGAGMMGAGGKGHETVRGWAIVSGNEPNENCAWKLIVYYDKNKDAKLDAKEFPYLGAGFAKLDRDADGALDLTDLACWRDVAPAARWHVDLHAAAGGKTPAIRVVLSGKDQGGVLRWHGTEVRLASNEIPVQPAQYNLVPIVGYLFQQPDIASRGYVTRTDLEKPQLQFYRPSFDLWDADRDGKVTKDEVGEYSKFFQQGLTAQVALTVQDEGRPLFGLLDDNRDGRLSYHDLRSAWQRIKGLDANGDGMVAREEIPHQFQISAGRATGGMAPNPRLGVMTAVSVLSGPGWFQKMDQNADGTVSRREFLGPLDAFGRIDLNRDGFIDRAEAERAAPVPAK